MGPKSQKLSASPDLNDGFGTPNRGQNRSKLLPRAIQKVIIFLIDLKIDFWSDLVPTWLYLDPQNPPKIEVSWHSNPSKLGHGFKCCFLQDVGSNFIDFERQDNMAYIAKIVKKLLVFFIFLGHRHQLVVLLLGSLVA